MANDQKPSGTAGEKFTVHVSCFCGEVHVEEFTDLNADKMLEVIYVAIVAGVPVQVFETHDITDAAREAATVYNQFVR